MNDKGLLNKEQLAALQPYIDNFHIFNSYEELAASPVYQIVKDHPLTQSGFYKWMHRSHLMPNKWNPNHVADPEMDLLLTSILEDGWTQPIVGVKNLEYEFEKLVIIDGFHRWKTSGRSDIKNFISDKTIYYCSFFEFVPVTRISDVKSTIDLMMTTIRHNRARGTHGVLAMAEIIKEFVRKGLSMQEIMKRLEMEKEEVERLALQVGISKTKFIQEHTFSRAYIPQDTE